MELSLTSVSKNRHFGKALRRNSSRIAEIENIAADVSTDTEVFDIFQIIFVDRPENYVHPIKPKMDRIFQMEVGMGEEKTFGPQYDNDFLALVCRQVDASLRQVPLNEDRRKTMLDRLGELTF